LVGNTKVVKIKINQYILGIITSCIFNCGQFGCFKILGNIDSGRPVNILIKQENKLLFLQADRYKNRVTFSEVISRSDDILRGWIFEKDTNTSENIYYIKNIYKRIDGLKYIGAPNINNDVYLYSSKNKFTRWKIESSSIDPIISIDTTKIISQNSDQMLGTDLNFKSNQKIVPENMPIRSVVRTIPITNRYQTQLTVPKIAPGGNFNISYAGEKFNTDDIQIIVARYEESIDWTNAYNDICIIYNKGKQIKEQCFSKIVCIPNKGREGGTYLYHIMTMYDQLKTKTIFTQASFLEHNETMFYGIDNYFEFNNPIQPMGLRYLKKTQVPPENYLNKYKTVTPYGFEYAAFEMDANLVPIPLFRDDGFSNLLVHIRQEYKEREFIMMTNVEGFLRRANFPGLGTHGSFSEKLYFTFSALFCVHRDAIHKHEKSVYSDLMAELISRNPQGGTNGYVLERIWLYIFGWKSKN
jgi:hypothetical protein